MSQHEPIREAELVTLPARIERSSVVLRPVMSPAEAMQSLSEFQSFVKSYLVEGIDNDFGTIPGTKKPTLFKPGADKLCEVYGLYDEYVFLSNKEDFETGLFDYVLKCVLRSRRDDSIVGTGLGSCSSYESKYRWREALRKCPTCGKENIRKSKNAGEGWYCWKKLDGCGATFKEGDKSVESQPTGRTENPDIIDAKNTVLKMAKKRAKIDAVIGVTRSSGIFTQDMDDIPPAVTTTAPPAPVTTEATPAPPPPAAAKAVDPNATIADDTGRQVAFHRAFKDAIKNERIKKEADRMCEDWLRAQGYVDADGRGTAKAIPVAKFEEAKRDAVKWVGSLV